MKILVFAHRLEYGGTQVNAIELAATLRDRQGHDVVLFATPGPLQKLAEDKGLRCIAAPDARIHPSPARMRALHEAIRQERPDLLHVWDWWQCLDAYYSAYLPRRVPMVVTDMMMDLTRVLPKRVPTTFGTPELAEQARAAGWRHVEALVPPVDVLANSPGAADPQPLRDRFSISEEEIAVVTVSRLANFMKSESLIRTIEAVRELGRRLPLRLVIVGDGAARPQLERLAAGVNAELGHRVVTLAGPMVDPRPAYAMADIVVGMGGSALRGMAFGKPLIVVGERGFSSLFTPENSEEFFYKGMYGLGDGRPDNERLAQALAELCGNAARRRELGKYGRRFVMKNHSLEVVSDRLDGFFRSAMANPAPLGFSMLDGLRTTFVYLRERRFLTPSRDPWPKTQRS